MIVHSDMRDFLEGDPGPYDLIIADPPYGRIVNETWDRTWTAEDYILFMGDLQMVVNPGATCYVWGGVGRPKDRVFFEFLSKVENLTHWTLHNVITWGKKRAYGTAHNYLFTREECAMFVMGERPFTFNVPYLDELRGYEGFNVKYPAKDARKRRTNVWSDVTEVMRGKKHPCEKPVRLAEILIETSSNPGDLVLDAFGGCGNVHRTAERMGRRCDYVDIDPNAYNAGLPK